MPRVLVLGSSNMDLVLKSERLPAPGETVLGEDYFRAFGGKGANQAVAAARAGADVAFIAAVGGDAFGGESLEQYRREAIDTSAVRVIKDRPSGVALILVDRKGQNMISVFPGANALLTPEHVRALPDALFDAPGVFVAQLETPIETVAAGLTQARSRGWTTILNPAPAAGADRIERLLRASDIVVPNETEIERLTGIRVTDAASAKEAARVLGEYGCRAIVITLGDQGCYCVTAGPEGQWAAAHLPAIEVSATDCVAAGDAFVGAMAARLAESPARNFLNEIASAAAWATHAAAISVTRPGAQPSLATRAEIDASWKKQT